MVDEAGEERVEAADCLGAGGQLQHQVSVEGPVEVGWGGGGVGGRDVACYSEEEVVF